MPRGEPVLIATNSTQKYDFIALRRAASSAGVKVVTVTKGKNYHDRIMALAMGHLGVVPLASRGYLILVDFTQTIGRRPSDLEYRRLRDAVDRDAALPDQEPFVALSGRARSLLGWDIAPARDGYGGALREVYRAVMAETVRLAGEAVRAGHHIQMYPEGTVSPRLGVGRTGAAQLARALGLAVVPVGMNGCPETFVGQGMAVRGGRIVIRVGEPMVPPPLATDFIPFDPDSERRHAAGLARFTGVIMDRIDALLDPPYRRAPDRPAPASDLRKFL